MESALPPIPAKRYFTIGEVGDLCGVKPHVLRYWEQEFTQLRPMKRRGNRRYYQHHEVLMIRRIRELLYNQGFTIIGARTRLQELDAGFRAKVLPSEPSAEADQPVMNPSEGEVVGLRDLELAGGPSIAGDQLQMLIKELTEIRDLLSFDESLRSHTL